MQLKRWESPRRQGRNDKGRGGSARARQLKKQQQMLRKKLKETPEAKKQNKLKGRDTTLFLYFFDRHLKTTAKLKKLTLPTLRPLREIKNYPNRVL